MSIIKKCFLHILRYSYSVLIYVIILCLPSQAFSQVGITEKSFQEETQIGAYISSVTHLFEAMGQDNNFLPFQLIGVPVGVNFWLNKQFTFSIEFVPEVRLQESVRMENFLFHPGFIWNFSERTNLAMRLAFDTSGRIGFTPVLGYKLIPLNQSSVALGIPFPLRFGNNLPPQFAIGLQLGWGV
jgi:hypothetical protein